MDTNDKGYIFFIYTQVPGTAKTNNVWLLGNLVCGGEKWGRTPEKKNPDLEKLHTERQCYKIIISRAWVWAPEEAHTAPVAVCVNFPTLGFKVPTHSAEIPQTESVVLVSFQEETGLQCRSPAETVAVHHEEEDLPTATTDCWGASSLFQHHQQASVLLRKTATVFVNKRVSQLFWRAFRCNYGDGWQVELCGSDETKPGFIFFLLSK